MCVGVDATYTSSVWAAEWSAMPVRWCRYCFIMTFWKCRFLKFDCKRSAIVAQLSITMLMCETDTTQNRPFLRISRPPSNTWFFGTTRAFNLYTKRHVDRV